MAIDEDLDPKHGPRRVKDLSQHSVAELEAYIASLREEAARAETEKAKKQAYSKTADSFFRKTE